MKRGRPKQPFKPPTPEQEAWLRKYYNNYTRKAMAVKLQVGVKLLRKWLKHMGIEKKRGPKIHSKPTPAPVLEPPAVKEIIRVEPPAKRERPRADHTNKSREQHIDYWLNYPI